MSNHSVKKPFLGGLSITDRESCIKAIKTGGVAAMISATITGALAISGFFINPSDKNFHPMMDPWLLVDALLIVVLGIFVFWKSRTASTLLVIYFVTSKLVLWFEVGAPSGLIMSVIFFLIYVSAMNGTYLWHSKYRDAPINTTGDPINE